MVAGLPLIEVAGVAVCVVAEPSAVLAGAATEPSDEDLPAAANDSTGRLAGLDHGAKASGPPPAGGDGAPAALGAADALPTLGLAHGGGPWDPEAAAAALGDVVSGGGNRCLVGHANLQLPGSSSPPFPSFETEEEGEQERRGGGGRKKRKGTMMEKL